MSKKRPRRRTSQRVANFAAICDAVGLLVLRLGDSVLRLGDSADRVLRAGAVFLQSAAIYEAARRLDLLPLLPLLP